MQALLILSIFGVVLAAGVVGIAAISYYISHRNEQSNTTAVADPPVNGTGNLNVLLQDYEDLLAAQNDERKKMTAALQRRQVDLELKTRQQRSELKELREKREKYNDVYRSDPKDSYGSLGRHSYSYWNPKTSRPPSVQSADRTEQAAWLAEKLRNYPRLSQMRREVTPREVDHVIQERAEHHAEVKDLMQSFLQADPDPMVPGGKGDERATIDQRSKI